MQTIAAAIVVYLTADIIVYSGLTGQHSFGTSPSSEPKSSPFRTASLSGSAAIRGPLIPARSLAETHTPSLWPKQAPTLCVPSVPTGTGNMLCDGSLSGIPNVIHVGPTGLSASAVQLTMSRLQDVSPEADTAPGDQDDLSVIQEFLPTINKLVQV